MSHYGHLILGCSNFGVFPFFIEIGSIEWKKLEHKELGKKMSKLSTLKKCKFAQYFAAGVSFYMTRTPVFSFMMIKTSLTTIYDAVTFLPKVVEGIKGRGNDSSYISIYRLFSHLFGCSVPERPGKRPEP